jgi:hypothetical protein
VTVTDTGEPVCYPPGGAPSTIALYVHIKITSGPSGVYTVSISLAGQTKLGTAYPGYNDDSPYLFTGIPFSPGGTFTATVTLGGDAGACPPASGSYISHPYCGTSS